MTGDDPRSERLREEATSVLGPIDKDREIQRLIEAGLDDEEIVTRMGTEQRIVRSVRADLREGIPIRPVTPEELGMRRFLGQISTEEMMERLRAWPYTFGRHHYDFYESGSWDEVVGLAMADYITGEEYRELKAVAEWLPGYPRG